jgi:hypothetical protein
MVCKNEYGKFMRWVSLAFSLIGLIPELGSAIKGVSKILFKRVGELATKLLDLLKLLKKYLPHIPDISHFRKLLNEKWGWIVTEALKFWNNGLNRVAKWVNRIPDVISSTVTKFKSSLTKIGSMATEKLAAALEWGGKKLDEILERLELKSTKAEEKAAEETISGAASRIAAHAELQKLGKRYTDVLAKLTDEGAAGIESILKLRASDGVAKVRQILDVFKGNPVNVIDDIFKTIKQVEGAKGVTHLIADMAAGETKTQGVLHVLNYVTRRLKGGGKSAEAFEHVIGNRKYDLLAGGKKFEFKDWTHIAKEAADQAKDEFVRDILLHADQGFDSLRWVFNPKV